MQAYERETRVVSCVETFIEKITILKKCFLLVKYFFFRFFFFFYIVLNINIIIKYYLN